MTELSVSVESQYKARGGKPMKRSVPLAVSLLATLLLTGCASAINKKMESWLGHHQSELIQAWGPPQQTASDGRGGTILIYGSYVNLGQTPGTVQPNGAGVQYTYPQQQGYKRTRMFYVNQKGIIYSYRWQGL